MSNRSSIGTLVLVFLLGACSNTMGRHAPSPSLEKMQTLAGAWETSAPKGEKEFVVYKPTSGGNALQETLFPGTPHEMVSVYYLDEGDLVMTHYCLEPNQPHLRAQVVEDGSYLFKFDGGTNIDPSRDSHMHELRVTFEGPDRIRQEWTGWDRGKPSHSKVLELTRVKG